MIGLPRLIDCRTLCHFSHSHFFRKNGFTTKISEAIAPFTLPRIYHIKSHRTYATLSKLRQQNVSVPTKPADWPEVLEAIPACEFEIGICCRSVATPCKRCTYSTSGKKVTRSVEPQAVALLETNLRCRIPWKYLDLFSR
jgi:hypothetical protein